MKETRQTRLPDFILKSMFIWLDRGTNRYENKKDAHGILRLFMSSRQDSGNCFSTLKKLSARFRRKGFCFWAMGPVIITGNYCRNGVKCNENNQC